MPVHGQRLSRIAEEVVLKAHLLVALGAQEVRECLARLPSVSDEPCLLGEAVERR